MEKDLKCLFYIILSCDASHICLDGDLFFPDSSLHRTDDQRGGVPPVILNTGVKVRVERLSEGAPAVRVDVSLCLCVVEGHRALLVVEEHADPLGDFLQVEGDGGASAGAEAAAFPPADRPVTAVGTHHDGPLPVDGLPGHAEIPVCFISNLSRANRTNLINEAIRAAAKSSNNSWCLVLFSRNCSDGPSDSHCLGTS